MRTVDMMADLIRDQVNNVEGEINYFLAQLGEESIGYSPNCLSMIRMERDAKTLRALADKIDAERERLMQPEHLMAAE